MGGGAIALNAARHLHQPPGNHRLAKGLIDRFPDDHIGGAGFILQRQEDHPGGGAGALAGDDKAGDDDAALGLCQAVMRQGFGQARAQQLHRVGAQGKAQRQVIFDHLLAQGHLWQGNGGFHPAFAIGAEQGQRRGRLQPLGGPKRIAARQAKGGKGIGLGQPLQRVGMHPGAAPQAFDIGITIAARRRDPARILGAQALDLAKAQPQGQPAIGAQFQRAIPQRVVDRNRAHLDPVVAGIAHQLGGGVKAHRLAVQKRAGEDRRVVALQPGRDIDQPGKAGRVAFGETIAAKAFDLGKTAGGEIGVIAARQHARHKAVAERADGAHAFEGGQRPAQAVGLGRGETGGDHGDLHGLFLKQGHAVGAGQHLHQGGAKVFDRFAPHAAVDERMHHAALNGAGAHDGHFADQIIELARAHPGQKVQLRPAFHLKDANGIGPAQHVIDLWVLGWHVGQRQPLAAMIGQKGKGLADGGQHAQRQNIHLEQSQRVDVVLVPFDDGAVVHRGVFNRAQLIQTAAGDDETADMLA